MSKIIGFRIGLVIGLMVSVTIIRPGPAWAAPNTMINESGKSLASVFEGLRANPAFQPDQLVKYRLLRRTWRGTLQSRLPGLLNVNILYGSNYCPVSSCSGNYNNFQDQPGGCNAVGCPNVQDAFTDLSEPCYYGVMDSECGDGSGVCCANAVECDNYRACPVS